MSLSSSSTDRRRENEETTVTDTATTAVANRVLLPVIPQPALGDSNEEQQNFFVEFETRVLNLVRQLSRHFPYKHSVQWSIEYGEEKEYCIHVMSSNGHQR